ncbi:MAG: group 1 truncated hemoglobin [Aestuariibacter sp.]
MQIKNFKRIVVSLLVFALVLLNVSCTSTQSAATLYEDIGGKKTLVRVYIIAVQRIYNDPRINHFFKGFPKKELVKHLTDQTCELIGGPCEYTGRSMQASHQDLGITDADMFALVEHVQQAMRDVGLTYQQENLIIKQLAPLKSDIVYQ